MVSVDWRIDGHEKNDRARNVYLFDGPSNLNPPPPSSTMFFLPNFARIYCFKFEYLVNHSKFYLELCFHPC